MVQNAAQTIRTGLQNENPGWNGEPLEKAYEFWHYYYYYNNNLNYYSN